PRGYRVALSGDCDGAACPYPLFMLTQTAEPTQYQGFFVREGRNVEVHLRAEQAGDATRLILVEQYQPAGDTPARAEPQSFNLRRVEP
ncbi:MAG: hypothetical protein AAGF49_17075, partial [Pseudomonadota bacterium]